MEVIVPMRLFRVGSRLATLPPPVEAARIPLLQETQFSPITSAIARHSLSMFPEVIPATLMRPESTM